MHYEMQANVYSVVRFRNGDEQDRILDRYLYDHTKLVQGYDLPSIHDCRFTAAILRTTVTQTYNENLIGIDGMNDRGQPTVRDLVRSTFVLAQGQIDRLASGLYAGRVCGDYAAAERYVEELA